MTEYIKREDALKMCGGEIQNIRYMTDAFGKRFEAVVGARRINADEIAEQIKKIPSADVVERKRGKWIKDCNVAFFWKCSECGAYILWRKEEYLLRNEDEPNYCPNCGSRMGLDGDTE